MKNGQTAAAVLLTAIVLWFVMQEPASTEDVQRRHEVEVAKLESAHQLKLERARLEKQLSRDTTRAELDNRTARRLQYQKCIERTPEEDCEQMWAIAEPVKREPARETQQYVETVAVNTAPPMGYEVPVRTAPKCDTRGCTTERCRRCEPW